MRTALILALCLVCIPLGATFQAPARARAPFRSVPPPPPVEDWLLNDMQGPLPCPDITRIPRADCWRLSHRVLQITGDRRAWNGDAAYARIDGKVGGLRIRLRGTCQVRQESCLRVKVVHWSPTEQDRRLNACCIWGMYRPWRYRWSQVEQRFIIRRAQIVLNAYYSPHPQKVAAHEFLHALGMPHHSAPGGLMTTLEPTVRESTEEIEAVRRAYP